MPHTNTAITPYYQDEQICLYHADCRKVMAEIEPDSIELAWTDPPYNVGKDYGEYKDNLSPEWYQQWCYLWVNELKTVAKSVAIYPPKIHLRWFWNLIPENHLVPLGWSPEGAIRNNYVHHYAPLLLPAKPLKRTKDLWYNLQVPGLGFFYREEKTGHPGQTSLDVTMRVITAFSNEGDTVIDPFMGSGTTGIACVRTGRKFIGIDIDSGSCDMARRRIEEARLQEPLIGGAA
jgi:DNA modification methylase